MSIRNFFRSSPSLFLLFIIGPCVSSAQNDRLWGSYYGGTGSDWGYSVATDVSGNVFLTGRTRSTSGIASGGYQNTFGGGSFVDDAFLVKFDSAGNRIWATYYGGIDNDIGSSVTADPSGNVYLAGYTKSTSGMASGGFQNTIGGGTDAFLAKFDLSGNLLWATYYGGSGFDQALSVVTDPSGNVYMTGRTQSANGISSSGFQANFGGGSNDAFLVKFDSSGNRIWATYYGGTGNEWGFNVATDASGKVYLSGQTTSSSGISFNGFKNTIGGGFDAFLVKFDSTGNRIWATYYGGAGEDGNVNGGSNMSISTDASGNVYLGGSTTSITGIASGGFQNTFGGGIYDAFLVKFDSSGSRLWATYYGGSGIGGLSEYGYGVATDASGNVYLGGCTYSYAGIAFGGFKNNFMGTDADQFLVKFDSNGTRLCATYYGQNSNEY